MNGDFSVTLASFESNLNAVARLLHFDDLIIEAAVGGLRRLQFELEQKNRNLAANTVANRALLLTNLKGADLLRPDYQIMFNQCVVLLVSHFGSALHTLFRQAVAAALRVGALVPAADEELKVSWRAVLAAEADRDLMFADLLIAKHEVSFQDMQSVVRAFKNHLDVNIERTSRTNNIIVGQAARHVIVHSGAIVDGKLLNQVRRANPRTLKPELPEIGQPIQFSTEEVEQLSSDMLAYVQQIVLTLQRSAHGWAETRPD
jgi:hypothetical protein